MKLQIQNYKCFKEQEINFGKITILAGSNSVGKSSVVQSLLLSRTAFELKQGNKLPLRGFFLLELGNSDEIFNRLAGVSGLIDFNYLRNGFTSQVTLKVSRDIDEPVIQKCNISSENSILGKEQFYYLNAERVGPRMIYRYVSQKFPHAGYKGEATFHLLSQKEKGIEIHPLLVFQPDQSNLLSLQTREWLNYIIPGATFDTVNTFGKSLDAEASFNESLPTNVGFGISYALPIIVNGLIAEQGSMFIVENPEAHLHPSGQSRIGRFLARVAASGVQVVVETHSEHIINGIRIATLVTNDLLPGEAVINFFSSEKEQPKVDELLVKDNGDLTRWPVGFFDQQQIDFAEMMEKKIKARG